MLSSSHRFSTVGKWLNGPWIAHPSTQHLGFILPEYSQQTKRLSSGGKLQSHFKHVGDLNTFLMYELYANHDESDFKRFQSSNTDMSHHLC